MLLGIENNPWPLTARKRAPKSYNRKEVNSAQNQSAWEQTLSPRAFRQELSIAIP